MVQSGLKLLKDFPRDEWFEAADGCDTCGARYRVKVNHVEEEGDYGEVLVRDAHKPECPLRSEAAPWGPDSYGVDERLEFAGWEYEDRKVALGGIEWTPINARGDVTICLNCGRLIIDVPLILFIDEGKKGELDFCSGCALELGLIPIARGG